jgi:hypothetical protein
MSERVESGFECVDVRVGERILDFETRKLQDGERDLLTAHLEVCAHCQLTLDLNRRLAEGIRQGTLLADAEVRRVPGWWRHPARWMSAAALAASLVFLAILPPQPVGPSMTLRGEDGPGFIRPVEGEVVGFENLAINWSAVPGAESYSIRLDDTTADGPHGGGWTHSTTEPTVVIPPGVLREEDSNYRVLLSTVPADLIPPGGISVTFRTGSLKAVAGHRARHGQPIAYLVSLAGLMLGAVSLIGKRA